MAAKRRSRRVARKLVPLDGEAPSKPEFRHPGAPCRVCRTDLWWRLGEDLPWVCWRCHPPTALLGSRTVQLARSGAGDDRVLLARDEAAKLAKRLFLAPEVAMLKLLARDRASEQRSAQADPPAPGGC